VAAQQKETGVPSRLVVACVVGLLGLAVPARADAGPREDGLAVFDRFLSAFTAADTEGVVGLFAPDALFWGTTLHDLATTPGAVRDYFSRLSAWKPSQRKASALGPASAVVLSGEAVLVSGLWTIEVAGQPTVTHRISLAVAKRGDRWLIAQFHNSPRP
jgi:uncharacterized protein (TIGR02246 family)